MDYWLRDTVLVVLAVDPIHSRNRNEWWCVNIGQINLYEQMFFFSLCPFSVTIIFGYIILYTRSKMMQVEAKIGKACLSANIQVSAIGAVAALATTWPALAGDNNDGDTTDAL